MLKLKQWGYNPDFPEIAETWKFGEKVPEWLSDQAKIAGFDSTGGLLLETYTDKNTGNKQFCAIIVEINDLTHKVTHIDRINVLN